MTALARLLRSVGVALAVLTLSTGCSAVSRTGALPAGGVATHLGYFDTPYADSAKVASAVKLLEAKLVRDGVSPNQGTGYYERIYAAFRSVNAKSGARFLLGAGRADDSVTAQLDAVAPLVANGIVWGIEGANEWDGVAGSTVGWEVQLEAHQKELYRQVKARWPSMPVVGPTLVHSDTARHVGDLSAYMDYGNLHYYGSTSGIDTRDLDRRIANAKTLSGSKPMWATEANGITGDGYPADTEQTQAVTMRTLYSLLGARGIERVFSYELVNGSRPSRPPTHRENNFGSFKVNTDGTWGTKPVFFEVRAANRRR